MRLGTIVGILEILELSAEQIQTYCATVHVRLFLTGRILPPTLRLRSSLHALDNQKTLDPHTPPS
jgi:hypothetical protein